MSRVDFVISNDRHHPAMVRPVVEWLSRNAELEMRVVSVCEFRGFRSPVDEFGRVGVPMVRINRLRLRSTPAAGSAVAARLSKHDREWARRAAWRLLLRRGFDKSWRRPPDLAVLPNDAAFPFDGMVRMLKERGTPFLLLQEGVRYLLPEGAEAGSLNQGRGGADAIAAWGESSAAYFRAKGNPPDRIHLAGNPRFDCIADENWSDRGRQVSKSLGLESETLLFLSNPIEDHAVCTAAEKLALVGSFFRSLAPVFERPGFRLAIKLHSQESEDEFRELFAELPYRDRIILTGDVPLYPLLSVVDGAVILSSTAGLEALLFGVPLAVLEIPGAGFLHDFVSGGGAVGLSSDGDIAGRVVELLEGRSVDPRRVEGYLETTLATRTEAAGRTGSLILELLDSIGG